MYGLKSRPNGVLRGQNPVAVISPMSDGSARIRTTNTGRTEGWTNP